MSESAAVAGAGAGATGGASAGGLGSAASFGSIVPVLGLALTAASTAYALHQAYGNNPAKTPKPSDPQAPQLGSAQSNQANSQRLAASAGGTITPGSGGGETVGNAPLTPRKTLLGS